jgi:Rieske Fe-S protein
MVSGLIAGYGMLAALAARFMYPSGREQSAWQFVSDLAGFTAGSSRTFTTPAGQKIVISRIGDAGTEQDFVALSSVCPHLGCAVHWESVNNRFFCPCHNGAFDPEGNPIAGPVKDANQPLTRFALKTENGLLYIHAATQSLVKPV